MAQTSSDCLPAQGLHVVQGELSTLLNSMRRAFKWSSQLYQEEEQDILLKNLNQLKEQLNQILYLSEIDLRVVLGPFLEVIRSEETTGPVMNLALSSVFKFLCYGLIDPSHESAAVAVESIADALNHAKFVGTDPGNDEVVLMKILVVLRMLVLCPAGVLLSNESVSQILQSCFRFCFETRLSELLRKSAEHFLSEMVRLLYSRLPQFPLQEAKGSINYKKLKMRTAAYDPSRGKKSHSPKTRPKTLFLSGDGGGTTYKSSLTAESPTQVVSEDQPAPQGSNGVEIRDPQLGSTISSISTRPNEIIEGDVSESVAALAAGEALICDPPKANLQGDGSPATENSAIVSLPVDPLKSAASPETTSIDGVTVESVTTDAAPEVLITLTSAQAHATSVDDYVNAQGVRFVPANSYVEDATPSATADRVHLPYGLPCVRELLHYLVSLINPLESQNTEAMTFVGLRLLTVAVETSADSIIKVPSLLVLIQDETCRHLFSLLSSEKLAVLTAASRLCYLLFEAMRSRLKFQLEMYISKLLEIVVHESPKMAFERRLVALEAIGHLCRIPGLVTELYLNYDCDCHAPDLFENLIQQLAKNVQPVSGIFATHLLSLETLLIVVDAIEANCSVSVSIGANETSSIQQTLLPPAARRSRFETSADVPTHQHLADIKYKKKLLIKGAEQFNVKPNSGIQFLQENKLLQEPLDATQVALFLRENPRLDKKQIGEFLSNRKNNSTLMAFVHSLDFTSKRIDEALRLYLETFRLPGEAPLISMLMDKFAEHWSLSNDQPFANVEAAFVLVYAIIMLNVDQHNTNVKRQNNPMTLDQFKRNLKGCNGGQDFDADMLEDIYLSICNEEIVMPAEQTGLVKDNYLWKMLLRRGTTKDGVFLHASNGLFDDDLLRLSWAPTVEALSSLLDRATEMTSVERMLAAFEKICFVAAHYGMSDVFDHVVVTLIKFTNLLGANTETSPIQQAVAFGNQPKVLAITQRLFWLVHKYGDVLRSGWKPLVELVLHLYRLNVLPDALVETVDPLDPLVKIKLVAEEAPSARSESSLVWSLYSLIALSDGPAGRGTSAEDQEALRRACACVVDCNVEQLITDSKFLQIDALQQLVKELIGATDLAHSKPHAVVFALELLTRITVQNRDRVTCIWGVVRDHVYSLVMAAAAAQHHFVLERSIVALLSLTGRLMRREDVAPLVLQSLRMLLLLKSQTLSRVSRHVSYGLHELLKTGAANVHTTGDWSVLFTLLECAGAGAAPPTVRDAPDVGETLSDRGYTSDSELCDNRKALSTAGGSNPELNVTPTGSASGWIVIGRQGDLQHCKAKQAAGKEYTIVHDRELLPHDPLALLKSCESLVFLVRDLAHITPENFESAVQCVRTFVEASLHGGVRPWQRHEQRPPTDRRPPAAGRDRSASSPTGRRNIQRSKSSPSSTGVYDVDEVEDEKLTSHYYLAAMQLLDLMHELHTGAARIHQWWTSEGDAGGFDCERPVSWSLWSRGWCPLLQGIARLCCDARRKVRTVAITYLQRSLLVQQLSAAEWESCFNTVLFPLVAQLLERNEVAEPLQHDRTHWEETRIRAATLLSKVFLQHLGPLQQLPTFTALWLTLLDFMDKYMKAEHNDLLAEAIPEMMKNNLLVMETAGVFGSADVQETQLWNMTWDRIDVFLPGLRQEVSRSRTPVSRLQPEVVAIDTNSDGYVEVSAQQSPELIEETLAPTSNSETTDEIKVGAPATEDAVPVVKEESISLDTVGTVDPVAASKGCLLNDAVPLEPTLPSSPDVSLVANEHGLISLLPQDLTDDLSSLPIPLLVRQQPLVTALWAEELPAGLPICAPAPIHMPASPQVFVESLNCEPVEPEATPTIDAPPQCVLMPTPCNLTENSLSSVSLLSSNDNKEDKLST